MSAAGPPRRFRLGLRHEVQILLPVSLLLLVVLSTFTLFSYRSAVARLGEERRGEAAALARVAAERGAAPGRRGGGGGALRASLDAAPRARGMAWVGAGGEVRAARGEMPSGDLLLPLAGRRPAEPSGVGPDGPGLSQTVAGFAPFLDGAGQPSYLRIDLPAEGLSQQQAALRILVPSVLLLDTAVLLLVLLSLRQLLTPYETLLARAREMGETGEIRSPREGEDEVGFLLETFDFALAELKARGASRNEEEIEALERTLSASLESGLLLLDRAGRSLAVNAVGARLLGVEVPPPGTPLEQLLAGHPRLLGMLAEAVAEGRSLKREEHAIEADGAVRTLGLTAHPLRRGDGSVRGYLVLFADLTEVLRKDQESRLAESLSSLGELAGGVAHELRNGLATVRGYLTLIERRPDEEPVADYLGEIRRETDHLGRVVEDFLSFARPGTARLAAVSLAAVAVRAAADPALAGFPVTVAAEPGAGEGIAGDEELLLRAIRNLLHNAAEAERQAGRRGPIELRIETRGGGTALSIADRGPGLPPEIRRNLFVPFTTGRAGGVGLGLALARRIVVLHGGRLSLDDRTDGGTLAVLFFPHDKPVTDGNRSGLGPTPGDAAEEAPLR
jgi:nitrogen fixation/metabolism regulation signal transduction histidine kinase